MSETPTIAYHKRETFHVPSDSLNQAAHLIDWKIF